MKAHRHAIQKLHCINSAYIYKTMEHADNINYKPRLDYAGYVMMTNVSLPILFSRARKSVSL